MAKTLKLNVSFPMTAVISTETVKEFQEARNAARSILADPDSKALKGEVKFRIELLASDKTDDEVLETIYRSGIRDFIRSDLAKEIGGSEANIRTGDCKVVFETREKPAEGCDCGSCMECHFRGETV